MLVGTVLLSFLRAPLIFPEGRKIFALEVRDEDGREHHLVSTNQPDIYDITGQPTILAAELAAGSRVKIANDGRVMRAIQVIEHRINNPFTSRK